MLQDFVDRNIKRIFNDGSEIVNFKYSKGQVIDYHNKDFQRSYLLRYFYAYFTDYYDIYKSLLDLNFLSYPIKVLSIGTGSSLDYYGLVFAMLELQGVKKLNKDELFYTGIDTVNWHYRKDLGNSNYRFIKADIANINMSERQNYNIITFPKSISDFTSNQFQSFKRRLTNTTFNEDWIILVNAFTRPGLQTKRFQDVISIFNTIHNYKSLDQKDEYGLYWDDDLRVSGVFDINYPRKEKAYLFRNGYPPMIKVKDLYSQIVRIEKEY